ncbi:MAG: thermitase [Solirubrobacteraceae bacterium]|nr:thermitase [Solirubrobacteraceae bacterium]
MHVRAFIVLSIATVLAAGPLASSAGAADDPLRPVQWALDAIHLGDLLGAGPQAAPAGAGAVVAIVDSGIDSTHPELAGKVIAGPDFVDGGAPDDANGHGTHLAGTVAAASGNDTGGAGIAPDAKLLAVRVLDANNNGSVSTITRGIDAATAAGADVINLSLNWPDSGASLTGVRAAMERAANAGIAIIVAAGNDARDHCEQPVLEGRALCVGAIDANMALASFSSHGSGLGIVAPGTNVVSTWPGGRYASASGTSEAAAQASGVAALLVGMGLHGEQIIQRLEQTARDIGPGGYDDSTGFGMLDAARAVDGATEGRIPPMLQITAARSAAQRTVRRRGLGVTCDAARPGTCRVRLRVRGVVVASGQRDVSGAGPVPVRATPTGAARRVLKGRHKLRGIIEAGLTGVPGARRPVTLAPSGRRNG